METSDISGARKAAGFWSTVGSVLGSEFEDIAERCREGNKAHRKGVVSACHALVDEQCDQLILDLLLKFFDDDDADVAKEAGNVFGRSEYFFSSAFAPQLALRFVESRAFELTAQSLTFALQRHSGDLSRFVDSIDKIVQRFTGASLERLAAERKLSRAIYDLPPILLRLYEQAEGARCRELRNRCLDFWDRLLEEGNVVDRAELRKLDQ
jgi:hypothetical protein